MVPEPVPGQSASDPTATRVLGPIFRSREQARSRIRTSLEHGGRLLLLVGESGSGKTWLWNRLGVERLADADWLGLDVSPGMTPTDLLRSIGRGLGLAGPVDPVRARAELADELWALSQDGHRWILVLDEAQNASGEVLEEIRLLANQAGRPEGFSAVILVAPTSFLRRLARRPGDLLDRRIDARVHLRPLDLTEATDLAGRLLPGGPPEPGAMERIHRDTSGNPRRLLEMLRARGDRPGEADRDRTPAARDVLPPAFPGVPPIAVGDGMIEVGWGPADADLIADPNTSPAKQAGWYEPPAEEVVEDPYATLQAREEWSRLAAEVGDPEILAETPGHPERAGTGRVWAEGQQGFAPYGIPFSRVRPSRDEE